MALYNFFSYNVEVQYKSCLFSRAMIFTLITTLINIILPFIIAYRSRGFWLKSYNFYEQPKVHFTYDYILMTETDDPNLPIICGDAPFVIQDTSEGSCLEFQAKEEDLNYDGKNDLVNFKFILNVPTDRIITSIRFIVAFDFQLNTICPFHMQSLGIIEGEFAHPSNGFNYYGDLKFHQLTQLPCLKNHVDIKYNNSILNQTHDLKENLIDYVLEQYFIRDISTQVMKINSRIHYGQTSNFILNIKLRVPEMQIRYQPNLLQEFKWAWPQYLSLVVIFYWIINRIKCFVFNNRLVRAWKDVPWKKQQ